MNAKKFFAFAAVAALFVGFTACEKKDEPKGDDPIVIDPVGGDETPDVSDLTVKEGFYTICFQPAAGTVCNDIYFVGNYAASDWKLDGANVKMEPMENFKGWYLAYIPVLEDGSALQGKPIQAKEDGSLDWDYQTGDETSWTVEAGDVTIEAGYSGEANLTYNDPTKAVIYKSASWKNGNSPCVAKVEHDYNVVVKVPAMCDESIVPSIIGTFNGWATGVAMTKAADGSYTATIHDAEGGNFKVKGSADDKWDVEIVTEKENGEWGGYDNTVLGTEVNVTVDLSGEKFAWNTCR